LVQDLGQCRSARRKLDECGREAGSVSGRQPEASGLMPEWQSDDNREQLIHAGWRKRKPRENNLFSGVWRRIGRERTAQDSNLQPSVP
jgi:hypothetical protein